MKYKDKCLRIIELAYSESYNEVELFKLLYDVVLANALKKALFSDHQYYDDFCNYMAGALYMRLIDKRKPPIKSISNYINTSIRGFFDEFSKAEFKQVIDTTILHNGDDVRCGLDEYVRSQLVAHNDAYTEMCSEEYIHKVPDIIYKFLEEQTYTKDKSQLANLHISVLWSMLEKKEKMYRLCPELANIFTLILVDVKSRLGKDVAETLKEEYLLPDDLKYLLFSEEVADE